MTQSTPKSGQINDVMRLAEINPEHINRLLSAYGLALRMVAPENGIPGSFWGDEEAGLVQTLRWRQDFLCGWSTGLRVAGCT